MATILIADDDPDIGLVFRLNLMDAGHDVLEARDGEQALELIEREPPDLLVLDLAMPGLNGWNVLARLAERPAGGAIPVLVVSAAAHEADRVRALRAGARAFLTKPFAREELLETVDRLLAGRQDAGALRSLEVYPDAYHHLAAVVESASDAIITKSLEGVILSWNRGAEETYGYTAEEAVGQPISILVPSDHANEVPELIARIKARERVDHYETQRIRKDGTRIDVSLSLSPIVDSNGHVAAASVIARDVSERKQRDRAVALALERERQAAETLRELDRLKSDFVSTVSHELRTPLTTIKGLADTLGARWDAFEDPVRLELVGRISTAASRLDHLIADFLDFSRLERGQVKIEARPWEARALVERTVAKVAPGLTEHVVEVEATPAHALADESLFARALENLLTNAAKFSPSGSRIRVTAGEADGEVVFRVADEGVGVEDADVARIFERFYRTEAGRAKPGTGIGLAIVKEFVEAQDGRVWVERNPGPGSTFAIALPHAGNR